MRVMLILAVFALSACATGPALDRQAALSCDAVNADTLERSDRRDPVKFPAPLWRLAFHGGHDYRADLPVTFDISPSGRVVNEAFEEAAGVPIRHNRFLRQSARKELGDRRYVLSGQTANGLVGCTEAISFEFDNPWDDDF